MGSVDREALVRRFTEASDELPAIVAGRVVPGVVTQREGELLEELDAIEYELGSEPSL